VLAELTSTPYAPSSSQVSYLQWPSPYPPRHTTISLVNLACLLVSFSFTCIAALGIYCPTTKRFIRSCTDLAPQINTLASLQHIDGSAEERALTRRDDLTITSGWRFYVNIRFGVALNVAAARAMVHSVVVVVLALAVGCTGFVTSVVVISLTWLVPSVRPSPPEITEKPQPRRAPPLTVSPQIDKTKSVVPRPEAVRHVSFDDHVSTVSLPEPVPTFTPPPRPPSLPIPLPHYNDRTLDCGAVSLPPAPASAPITANSSPLSSAETLTEAPAEVKRAFSARLTRVLLYPRARRLSRSSTLASTATSSSSATVVSEFGESDHSKLEKGERRASSDVRRPYVTERGRFGFLKKSKTVDVQPDSGRKPHPLSLPLTASLNSSADSILYPPLTDSPGPISAPLPGGPERRQHRRVDSNPTVSSKLRIADKIYPRKEKGRGVEPKPKPARTQPYGPPYNWVPPTPGAWAVTEEADEPLVTLGGRRERASAPVVPSSPQDVSRHGHERSGSESVPHHLTNVL